MPPIDQWAPEDGPSPPTAHPETSDLEAGWWMVDVESYERAAYVASDLGPGGEPLCEWIDVRAVMWERARATDPA